MAVDLCANKTHKMLDMVCADFSQTERNVCWQIVFGSEEFFFLQSHFCLATVIQWEKQFDRPSVSGNC